MPGPIDRTTIEARIAAYLIDNSGVPVTAPLSPDEPLLGTGILDSLGIAEITEFLEREFAIAIDEDEIAARNYGTLSRLTDFCLGKLAAAAA